MNDSGSNSPVGWALRSLPSVDRVMREPVLAGGTWPRALVVESVRETLSAARKRAADEGSVAELSTLVADVLERLRQRSTPSLQRVINATGVILHTNLGRAPVSEAAARAMAEVSSSYSNLEFDLDSGERGTRHVHLRSLLQDVTGAEDGLAVNNNAGAVLLALSALASGREVIVSRGQAVEIGGGFRIPDVLRQSGADLVEVGTTNRTYLSDYEAAITPRTAAILRVHPSNFRVEGFVHSVSVVELGELGSRAGVPIVDDVGSGALLDPAAFGLGAEPLVQESVRAGAAVVCFSGDKLLGGPQAGLIVGKRESVERIRRHPLARALRIDKSCLAGLEATLRHYQRGEATEHIPIWRMIAHSETELQRRARRIVTAVNSPRARIAPTRATVGGGSLPQETLPSWSVLVAPDEASGQSSSSLARRLRGYQPAIVGRIEQDAVLLDLRTAAPSDDDVIAEALRGLLG